MTIPTSSNNSREIVRRWLDALMAGDIGTVLGLFSDDCIIRLPGDPKSTPWAGEWRGTDAINRCFGIIGETLEIRSHDFRKIICDGEDVIVIGDEVSASKITGRLIRQTYAWWFQVIGGKITLYQLFEDTEAIAKAYLPMASDSQGGLEARIARLEDMEAIRKLKHKYCAYCDDHYNPEGIASLWIEGGVWDAGPNFGRYVGREAIAGFFRGVGPIVDFAAHLVMNEVINVDEGGVTANGKWWCLMPSTFIQNGQKVDRWLFAEYTEEYAKVDGIWFFKSLRSDIHKDAPHLEGWANVGRKK